MSVDIALKFLLDQLTKILKYNYDLIKSIDPNIKMLQEELEYLESLVKDFQKRNHGSDYVDRTARSIREIIWRAEDAVESFVAARNASRILPLGFSRPNFVLDKAKEINSIVEDIKKIRREHIPVALDTLIIEASAPGESNTLERPKVEEKNVIGFETAEEDVEKLLLEGPEQLEVVSIVGMLGLGKTTLANKVFKSEKVGFKFLIRAFVYVSKDYNKKDVFLQILKSFMTVDDNVNRMKTDDLQVYVHEQLVGNPYVIVLDDVWETRDWDELKDVFPENNMRCRVLITTRDVNVAEYANRNREPYKLAFLPTGKSRELLSWRVFGTSSCPNLDLVEYELKIASKCGGLPLSIVVVAGILLNHKNNLGFWKEVSERVENYMEPDNEQSTRVKEVIELMYKHLPTYLKLCFIYFGVFREESEIPVWKMIRLWIAEGFIQSGDNSNLEDMAEVYLEELVSRNLVLVDRKKTDEKIKTCRMHDTLRDFCKKKAKEESLFHQIIQAGSAVRIAGVKSPSECRRLYINNADIHKYMSGRSPGESVRSFLTFPRDKVTLKPKDTARIPKAFKLLRVLEIQSLSFTLYPPELSTLILLKYISISSNFSHVPSDFSSMFHLQTLIVSTTNSSLEIRADIWKLPQFRHLHTNVPTILPNPKRGNPSVSDSYVQTLSTISTASCKGEVLKRTPNLRKLGIQGNLSEVIKDSGESSLFDCLCSLEYLENVKLLNDCKTSKLNRLPSQDCFPKQLTKLTLMNTKLEWGEMSKLGKLGKLKVLMLKEFAFEGGLWKTENGDFRRLKHLHIGRTDLLVWEVASADHFPELRSLKLDNCVALQDMPQQLGAIPSLLAVSLYYTNATLAGSAKKSFKNCSLLLSVFPPEH